MYRFYPGKGKLIGLIMLTGLCSLMTITLFGNMEIMPALANFSNIYNNFSEVESDVTLVMNDGEISPTNCDYNRIGDCYDYKNGIAYVWIENGTATLPQHFGGDRNYTVREGYSVIPLSNNAEK